MKRPPSSAAFVLYQNVMRIWRTLFSLASLLMIVATILLGYAALHVETWIILVVGVPIGMITGWLLVTTDAWQRGLILVGSSTPR